MEVCRLCLDLLHDNFVELSPPFKCIISNIIPEVNLDLTSDPIICDNCAGSVNELHTFKNSCSESQQKLKQKLNGQLDSELTDREILYGTGDMHQTGTPTKSKERICHTCLESIDCESFTILRPSSPDAYLNSMLTMCLPEMDLEISRDPVMCQKCLTSLEKLHHLKTTTLDVEEKLRNYLAAANKCEKLPVNLHDVLEAIQCMRDEPNFINVTKFKSEKIDDNDGMEFKEIDSNIPQGATIKQEDLNIKLEEFLTGLDLQSKVGRKPVRDIVRDVPCNICKKMFPNIWAMQRHQLTHTGEKKFECYECHTRYAQKSILIKHIRSRHTGEKPYKCDLCPKAFTAKSNLNSHYKTHQGIRPYRCEICGHMFSQRSNLKKHLYGHTGEKTFECEVCHKMFVTKYNLRSHMEVHNGEKPYTCDLCPESFRHATPLKVHRLSHFGKCPFTCGTCGMQFVNQSGLTNHEKTHLGDKPFECPYCGKRFVKENIVTSHITLHTGEKQFQCFLCKRRYADKSKLNYHLKKRCLKNVSLSIIVR